MTIHDCLMCTLHTVRDFKNAIVHFFHYLLKRFASINAALIFGENAIFAICNSAIYFVRIAHHLSNNAIIYIPSVSHTCVMCLPTNISIKNNKYTEVKDNPAVLLYPLIHKSSRIHRVLAAHTSLTRLKESVEKSKVKPKSFY